jgi:Glycosyltransferase family 87
MANTSAIRAKSGFSLGVGAVLLLLIALGCLALHVVHIVAKFRANPADAFSDFNLYLYAFNAVLHDPVRLYDHDALVAFLQGIGARSTGDDVFYAYPPQFALVFSPLSLLTPLAAKIVWFSASVALFAIGVFLLVKMAYRDDERSVGVLMVAIVLLSFPLLEDTYDGQSNELLFFLLVATFFLVDRGNRYIAGLFLGFAVAIKVTPLAIVGLLLLRREWRTVVTTMVVSIALTLLTAAQLGSRVLWQYFLSDMPRLNDMALAMGGGGAPSNNSVRGALQTLSAFAGMPLSGDTVAVISAAFALAACVFSGWLILRRHQDSRMDYALAIMTMLVVYPVLESIHMVLALIPMLILLGTSFEARTVQLSAIGPKLEMLLGAFAVLLLFFSARFVSYTVASLIIYGLCLARYFSPSMKYRRHRARRLA